MRILIPLFVLLFHNNFVAQLTLGNGHHVLEISGGISTYYNHRIIKEDAVNQNKNNDRFRLRDAQIQLEGRYKNVVEYELQLDFVDLASFSTGVVDPENPGLMDAYAIYKGLKFINVQVGYGKHYYSRSSMVPFIFTPYWQRAQIVRGDFFSRRDVGVTLMKDFWRQRINVYAGIYTGLGELSLRGDNDASGQPEYAGRIDFAYPARYRYRDIDDKVSPIPMFAVGVNGRYANKKLPQGVGFPAFATGEYGLKVINGEKYTYGMDASFQYMGFSAQFEIHQLLMRPIRENDLLYQGIPAIQHEGYVLAGGYFTQVNYFAKKLKSIFSVRFEQLDINDLSPGSSERLSFAAAYQIRGFDTMIKFQYFNVLKEETQLDPLRWKEQFRIGIQHNFK